MRGLPLERIERVVDGGADERMHEPERRLRPEDVDPRERARGLGGGPHVQAGERCRLVRVGAVAENRDRVGELGSRRGEAGQAKRDRARAGLRLELAETRHVGLGWREALRRDRAHELAKEERVPAGLLPAGGAEGLVGIRRKDLADEPRRLPRH